MASTGHAVVDVGIIAGALILVIIFMMGYDN
jgi:hypothetical protein